jgi:hypothetical protein
MISVDIISHNIPGSGFRRNYLSSSDFIVYSNENSFRVYFLKHKFKTICHIIYQKLELDYEESEDNEDNKDNEDSEDTYDLLEMIFGPRSKKISIKIGLYPILNGINNCSDFLKLVINKID